MEPNSTVCDSCETEYTLISDKTQIYCPFCGVELVDFYDEEAIGEDYEE